MRAVKQWTWHVDLAVENAHANGFSHATAQAAPQAHCRNSQSGIRCPLGEPRILSAALSFFIAAARLIPRLAWPTGNKSAQKRSRNMARRKDFWSVTKIPHLGTMALASRFAALNPGYGP
jgi:hypothetical protein